MASPSRRVSEEVPCIFETPVATRSSKRVHGSVTNLRSHKRRRVSMSANELGEVDTERVAGPSRLAGPVSDRFIPSRPKTSLPLNITPRTNRISKQFGLVDDRVLSFRDSENLPSSPTRRDNTTMSLLRRSASSLFDTRPAVRETSVVENLSKRRQSLMVLDSPGVPLDAEAYPISWSRQNLIAVACKDDVYFQDLDTKAVTHLCNASHLGGLQVLQWGEEDRPSNIALGLSTGIVALWDAGQKKCKDKWYIGEEDVDELLSVKSLAWNRDLLAIGLDGGVISMLDLRSPREIPTVKKHQASVLSLQWSFDKTYLASGDRDGVVQIWDLRNGKSLLESSKPATKIRHRGSARAMAWCPWKTDLLATGSTAPEGMIKIWSTTSLAPHSPTPVNTIELNTSVHSLLWSPHCKELLSTHGPSFTTLPTPARRRTLSSPTPLFSLTVPSSPLTTSSALSAQNIVNTLPTAITTPIRGPRLFAYSPASASSSSIHPHSHRKPSVKHTPSPLSNSIAVHAYPSCTRLLTLTKAHAGPVTQSCVGPTGECVFTLCPAEEAIKMWQVWGKRPPVKKEESAFEKYRIR
ncbi:hypothetical protein D9619_008985 [Psilocybe cf. subviscida]|uniref:Anaphase-promoting complex subunit 4 WD40 domain-containing protein n=1 Tax=Psilocybe cf. subviscida TaxID=2480587 RepID=A0A8H5BVG5_9AGAR|nr:hypothetical protein D9619_008985 [Psilocybe cf. subviscida]